MAADPIPVRNLPFPVVDGKAFGAACRPPPPVALPDFCVVPGPNNMLMLIPADRLTGCARRSLDEGDVM